MRIVIVGVGNVGFHLAQHLHATSHQVIQVFSRKITKARKAGRLIGCAFTNDLSSINAKADLYILAVKDDAVVSVATTLQKKTKGALIVHTSGSVPGRWFKGICKRYGVFYPLQTFSREQVPDFNTIPICVDANLKRDRERLFQLGKLLSKKVYYISDEERAKIHVAAVFVNNFTNHLFEVGESIMETENLPFDILRPLILETAEKIRRGSPGDMQTGPAKRGDQKTIERHLQFLEKHPHYQALYRLLTKSIQTS